MTIRTRVALALGLSLLGGGAFAQQAAVTPDRAARTTGLRIQTQMQMQMALPGRNLQDVAEQVSQQEVARRALYEMANRECRTLREVFGGECRLTSINTNTNVQQRHAGGTATETIVVSGTAAFEVTVPAPQ